MSDDELSQLCNDVTLCIKKLIKDKMDCGINYDYERLCTISSCIIDEIGCRTESLSSLEKEYCGCLQRYCQSCYYKEKATGRELTRVREGIKNTIINCYRNSIVMIKNVL